MNCIRSVKYLYLQFKFLARRGHTRFEGSKSAKKYGKKCGQNDRKFQNLLEVLKWHENNSVGKFRGKNELFPPFEPFYPKWTIRFLLSNIGK